MSRSVNKTILIGNVGSSPEVRTLGAGNKLAKFSMATSRRDAKGNESTQWHRITVFGKTADVVEQYVKKGDRLFVEGHIEYSEYEKNGVMMKSTDIIVDELVMLGGNERVAE